MFYHENRIDHTILILFLGAAVVTLFYITAAIYDANASNNDASTGSIAGAVEIGDPFYEEHYVAELGKPETSNKSFTGNFTREGILNGNLSVVVEGNVTGTFRNNDTVFLQGNAKFVTENEDIAVYSFDAFTNYNPDGTSEGSGVATFNDGATGELSSLSNILAVYKNHVDSNGNGTFLMWHWK